MKIKELINSIISCSKGVWIGRVITPENTRDQVLFGDPDIECTGVVTTCYASIDVIRQAIQENCNFIICHESLFWNHGDHTDWLEDNETFQYKRRLLAENHICIWRDHDYIHSGLKVGESYYDGIFYGLAHMMGWEEYCLDREASMPQNYQIPAVNLKDFVQVLIRKFNLNGVRIIGNTNAEISRIYVPMHILGKDADRDIIQKINDEKIDCILSMELVDFTVNEYVRDCAMAGQNKCIIALGHFNLEEIGMNYLAEYIRTNIPFDQKIVFVPSADTYAYMMKTEN